MTINVAKLRAKAGWTLRVLAKKCGLSRQTVLRVERGEGSLPASMKVWTALGVKTKDQMRETVVYFKSRAVAKPKAKIAATAKRPT